MEQWPRGGSRPIRIRRVVGSRGLVGSNYETSDRLALRVPSEPAAPLSPQSLTGGPTCWVAHMSMGHAGSVRSSRENYRAETGGFFFL